MEHWKEFAGTVLVSSAVTSGALTLLAWLFKTQISHWLVKDLEALKARHQQELAAYKVSLISDEERLRALQSVKTAAALRSVERKFATFEVLARKLQGHLSYIGAARAMVYHAIEHRTAQVQLCQDRVEAVNDALADAAPFLTREQHGDVLLFNREVNSLLVEYGMLPGLGPIPVEAGRLRALGQMQVNVSSSMHALLGAMMEVD